MKLVFILLIGFSVCYGQNVNEQRKSIESITQSAISIFNHCISEK